MDRRGVATTGGDDGRRGVWRTCDDVQGLPGPLAMGRDRFEDDPTVQSRDASMRNHADLAGRVRVSDVEEHDSPPVKGNSPASSGGYTCSPSPWACSSFRRMRALTRHTPRKAALRSCPLLAPCRIAGDRLVAEGGLVGALVTCSGERSSIDSPLDRLSEASRAPLSTVLSLAK